MIERKQKQIADTSFFVIKNSKTERGIYGRIEKHR